MTEATPLNFPDNASLLEANFVLNRDGSRQRRLGMDFEKDYGTTEVDETFNTINDVDSIIWKNASNNKSFDIAVVKVRDKLYFFDNNAETVSANPINLGAPITIPSLDVNGDRPIEFDYAFVHGYMIIVAGTDVVYILDFDKEKELSGQTSIVLTARRLKVRDLFGIDEPGVADDYRPIDISGDGGIHEYNLRNQGWLNNLQCSYKGALEALPTDSIQYTFDNESLYPSNADMVWANKAASFATDPLVVNTYDPFELVKATYGNQEAPKGRYIIDLFQRGVSRVDEAATDLTVLDDPRAIKDETLGGIVAVTDYMGRAVYACNEVRVESGDDNTPSLGSMLLFSQAKDKKGALTKCHTELDPTAGDEFANLATDGGYVIITGLGQINSLESSGNSLYVFSDRGVWQIDGGDRLFTMTNVNQVKITNVGSIGRRSVTVAEGGLFYLSDGGIYMVSKTSEDSKGAEAQNITQSTIQTFYDKIPSFAKSNSVSYYDRFTRQVKWLFADKTMPNPNYFNMEVVFDMNLGAFTISKIKELSPAGVSPFIVGYLERPGLINELFEDQITADGELVFINEGLPSQEPVTTSRRDVALIVESSNKYWCVVNLGGKPVITVAQYSDVQFLDWRAVDGVGVDALAYLVTGHATAGQSSVFKRIPYITTYMRFTDDKLIETPEGDYVSENPSSCLLQVVWEWTNSPSSNRWSNQQEIYRLPRTFNPDSVDFQYGHTIVTTRNRIRGKGKSFSLLFQTKPLYDCHIYGWSLELNAEINV